MLTLSATVAQSSALFEPPTGRQLLVIGQDLGAVGGFPKPNNDGYFDHLKIAPAGITTYLSLPELRGMEEKANLSAGDLWAQGIVNNPAYTNSTLVIGLHLVSEEKNVADGAHDEAIKRLGNWIKKTKRPVFLRIGYEFDGSWNHYDPENYKKAFQRIVTVLRKVGVTNCATVWQAATSPVNGNKRDISEWYPGDDYVDWLGYSWFLTGERQIELSDTLVNFARTHGKPVMVCESAPQGYDLARLTKRSIFKGTNPKPKTPDQIWQEWYFPFFDYIAKNSDTIRAVAYINVNWDAQMMWGSPYLSGYWGDSRVEVNPLIKSQWLETIADPKWMRASPTLFDELGLK